MKKSLFFLLMFGIGVVRLGAQEIGVQPQPMGVYIFNPGTDQFNKTANSYALFPQQNTPQPIAFYGFNSSLGQWTPCTSNSSCPNPFAPSGVVSLNGLTGALTLTSTGNSVSITPSGSSIDIENLGVTSAAATAPIEVNGGAGPATGAINISCPTCGNDLSMQLVPPAGGQYVVVYPTAFTDGATGQGFATGGDTGGNLGSAELISPSGEAGTSQIIWNTPPLPSYVNPANVTAIYAFQISSSAAGPLPTGGVALCGGMTGIPWAINDSFVTHFTASGTGAANEDLTNGGIGESYALATVTAQMTGLTGANFHTAAIEADFSTSGDCLSSAGTNVPLVGWFVYYTGSAPPSSTALQIIPPLNYNATLNELSIDPLAEFPGTALVPTTVKGLPAAANFTDWIVAVIDGTSSTDCSTGAGTHYVQCQSNGSSWSAFVPSGSMIYPGAGVANSTGSAWGTSYTVGTAANDLVQLNGSAQLPAVSGALLTNLPTVPLSQLAVQAADSLVMNATGGSASPTAVAMPTSGTNGCAGSTNALIYNTTSHALGCNTISAGGSGTVNSGSGYALPAYGSGASTTVGPSNLTTDASGNDIIVPGDASVGASPPALAGQINLSSQGTGPTATSGQLSCSVVSNVFECTNNASSVFNSLLGFAADGVTLTESGVTLSCATATTSNHGCVEPDGTSTHFLNGSGGWTAPASSGGNVFNLCSLVSLTNATCTGGQIVPNASQTTFTVGSIPQTYLNLDFSCDMRSTDTTTGDFSDSATTFNSITAYSYFSSQVNTTSVTVNPQGFNVTTMQLWDIANANATAGYSGGGELVLLNYAGTTFNKHGWFTNGLTEPASAGNPAATNTFIYRGDFWSMSTAAITSIKETLNHGNYATGTTCTLYGTN